MSIPFPLALLPEIVLPEVSVSHTEYMFVKERICRNCVFWENRTDFPRPLYQTCYRLGSAEAGRTDVRAAMAIDKFVSREDFGCTEFEERD